MCQAQVGRHRPVGRQPLAAAEQEREQPHKQVAPAVLVAVAGGALLYALPSPADTQTTDETPAANGSPTPSGSASAGPAPRVVRGNAITFRFGVIQADVELTGTRITDITTVQPPGGGYQQYTDRAIPR
jgi:hypothetical protein